MSADQASTEPDAERERTQVMADAARVADVSHKTVSRVLNQYPNVRSGTRDRVLAASSSPVNEHCDDAAPHRRTQNARNTESG
jgi:hypothetical protein